MNKIGQVMSAWEGADGTCVHVSEGAGFFADFEKVRQLVHPVKKVGTYLVLETRESVHMPFVGSPEVLLDKSGVLVIFQSGSYTRPDGNDVFPAPNNAAIYNADGTLRCQVHFAGRPEWTSDYIIERPFTRSIAYKELPIGRPGEPIDPPIVQFGVLVGTKDRPPESFFVLNTETGELTDGLYTVPY
ncbi:MAG: hypothetical protein AB7S86_04425 [Hydrogenophaga sp.]|uniref:hypothetical protein n=1 Tax=Hydrogenophaga sp. TaxID=1904254 RepID=UPI003D144491